MFEAWNVAKGRKVQGGRILSQGTVEESSERGEEIEDNDSQGPSLRFGRRDDPWCQQSLSGDDSLAAP